jgi:hypothetical protein
VRIPAHALLGRFVDLHRTVESANATLEDRVKQALADVKVLRGFIPICASCKKMRDDQGFWTRIEEYLTEHSEASLSHGICPDCARQLYPELVAKREQASGPRRPAGEVVAQGRFDFCAHSARRATSSQLTLSMKASM